MPRGVRQQQGRLTAVVAAVLFSLPLTLVPVGPPMPGLGGGAGTRLGVPELPEEETKHSELLLSVRGRFSRGQSPIIVPNPGRISSPGGVRAGLRAARLHHFIFGGREIRPRHQSLCC